MSLEKKIITLLQSSALPYELMEHDQAPTCELAAKLRKKPLQAGVKTVLIKDKTRFALFSLRANRKVDSKKVRKILGSQKLRFATEDELIDLTEARKGALPPFGRELFSLDLYLDTSVHDHPEVAFNIGVTTRSCVLTTQDYLKLVRPHLVEFSS